MSEGYHGVGGAQFAPRIVEKSALVGGVGPPYISMYRDLNAYVVNHQVVATVDFPLALTGTFSSAFLLLRGSKLVATVALDTNGWVLQNARLAGRWDTRNMLSGLQVVKDPLNAGRHLCGDDPTYQSLRVEICKAADLATDPRNDGTSATCDALSLAVGAVTEPALLDGVQDDTAAGITPCGPAYSDQCTP